MNSFTARLATPATATADPSKHVNYAFGMVLGVDDFTQEFAYLAGRDRWLARDCVGYGTVAGLAVSIEKNNATGDTEVIVSPGAAVSPRGQLIRVAPAQCASLTKWLASEQNVERIKQRVGAPPHGPLRLYVVLCYRDCPTDRVPIPGEPCRSEETATAPSRLQDDFMLELRFDPPAQTEEDALRDFIKWLNDHVEITDAPGPVTDLSAFLDTLRQSATPLLSPPAGSPPDFMHDLTSPIAPVAVAHIPAADACRYLRAAFRVWTTELRPRWRPANLDQPAACDAGDVATPPASDDALLLAELAVPLAADGRLNEALAVGKDEERRPFLLHLRMLQEWLLCARFDQAASIMQVLSPPAGPPPTQTEAAHTFATLYQRRPTIIRAWLHHPQILDVPGAAIRIEASETPNPIAAQPANVTRIAPGLNVFDLQLTGPLAPLSRVAVRFDATRIIELTSLPRPLLDALNEHGNTYMLDRDGQTLSAYLGVNAIRLDDLTDVAAPTPQESQVLTFQGGRWIAAQPPVGGGGAPTGAAGGDLAGTYPAPTVARLQTRTVSNAVPNAGDVLTWDQSQLQWRPNAPAAPQADLRRMLPFVTIGIATLDPPVYRLWFNLDAPENRVAITRLTVDAVRALAESANAATVFIEPLQLTIRPQTVRNVFDFQINRAAPQLRFLFELSLIGVQQQGVGDMSMSDYVQRNNLNFVGFDGRKTVTAFAPFVFGRLIG